MTAVAAYLISNACRSPAFFLLWQDKFWSAPSSVTLANVKEFGTTFHIVSLALSNFRFCFSSSRNPASLSAGKREAVA